ncbi:MAG: outer membrane beta-barrel domain-containing protein [Myxococcales bacterium]|nr:outer membrane beta-barrel domain-containing protein [Myxococcales bacterium]MCB9549393.1 outer membrane beta-barrel domain-containing protein [Myxococcales bacterium]
MRSRLLIPIALAALLVPVLAQAANIQGPRRTALERLEEGDAIRRRLILRGGRFELAPAVGFTLNDPFTRNLLYGAQITYHVSDSFGIGVTGFGAYGFNSDLADRIESERPERAKQGTFGTVTAMGTLDFQFTPIIGKFALFGRQVFNYDLHVLAGIGVTQVGGATELEDLPITPVAGVGLRAFVTNGFAINLEVRDYLYSASTNSVPNADSGGKAEATDSSFSNHFAITIGAGFFFPQEPQRAR